MQPAAEFGEHDAVFNIGTAARKSGLSVTTIRTWEDRYGVVVPVRDASGRRLYSPEQIAQLTWLREQIEGGLRAAEAHRLLMAGEEGIREPTRTIGDRGAGWATVLAWAQEETGWIGAVLSDLERGVGAAVAAMGPIIDNPLCGPVLDLAVQSNDATRLAEEIAVERIDRVPGLAEALRKGEVSSVPGPEIGSSAGTIVLAPIRVGGTPAGVVAVFDATSPAAGEIAAKAAQVIESRIEADRARSAFASLLD